MKKLLSVILLSIILVGCNSAFNEYVEKGDKALASADFNEALINYELALEEQPDNEEVQGKVDFLEDVIQLFELVAEYNWEEADEVIKMVLNNEHISAVDGLQADLEEMEQIVGNNLENDRNVKAALNHITKLLENEQVDKAAEEVEKLKQDHIVVRFSEELEEIEKEIEQTNKVIAENERTQAEKVRKQAENERQQEATAQKDESPKSGAEDAFYPNAEYTATAKSKQNQSGTANSDSGLVYQMEIRGDQLVVWGSLQVFEQGSGNPIYLEDKERTFTLANDVNLGLEWVGNKEEQIKYFNETGTNLNAAAVSFMTVNGKVAAIGFAG